MGPFGRAESQGAGDWGGAGVVVGWGVWCGGVAVMVSVECCRRSRCLWVFWCAGESGW